MAGTPHTHEAPDDIVYVHAAWGGSGQLARHLREKHGMAVQVGTTVADLRLRHAEAHAQVLSDGDRMLIVGQELRDHAAALLRRMRERTAEIEHTVLDPGPGQEEIPLTTLDQVEEWLDLQVARLRQGQNL